MHLEAFLMYHQIFLFSRDVFTKQKDRATGVFLQETLEKEALSNCYANKLENNQSRHLV
jgi:hypothetical protein